MPPESGRPVLPRSDTSETRIVNLVGVPTLMGQPGAEWKLWIHRLMIAMVAIGPVGRVRIPAEVDRPNVWQILFDHVAESRVSSFEYREIVLELGSSSTVAYERTPDRYVAHVQHALLHDIGEPDVVAPNRDEQSVNRARRYRTSPIWSAASRQTARLSRLRIGPDHLAARGGDHLIDLWFERLVIARRWFWSVVRREQPRLHLGT